MMLRKRIAVLTLALAIIGSSAFGGPAATPPDDGPSYAVLTVANFARIQEFILKNGRPKTYCTTYTNNPFFRFGEFNAYLNPTGPGNADCVLGKSAFNHLVIHWSPEGNPKKYWDVRLDGAKKALIIERRDAKAERVVVHAEVAAFFDKALAEIDRIAALPAPPPPPPTPAPPREPVTLEYVQRLYRERDLFGLRNIWTTEMNVLPLADRNAIALLAAEHLTLKDYPKGPKYADFKAYMHNLPENHPLLQQAVISGASARILDHLCRSLELLTTEPRIIPHLIDALEHPDHEYVGERSLQCLQSLTFAGVSDLWDTAPRASRTRDRVVAWWRDWWKQNADRHPVCDDEFRDLVNKRVLAITGVIEKDVKPKFWQLSDYKPWVPDRRMHVSALPPLWSDAYDPDRRLDPNFRAAVERVNPPITKTWFVVSARYATPALLSDRNREAVDKRRPKPWLAELQDQIMTVYSESVPGTDVVIDVNIATTDANLAACMAIALADHRPAKP